MAAFAGVEHQPRIADDHLAELLSALPAVSIEGPRAVGKTWTASRLANTVYPLDDPEVFADVQADPHKLSRGEPPILIDEWQRLGSAWDIVRRAVDRDFSPGQFILTGSARPRTQPVHSGAGRMVTLRMWTTTLAERHQGLAAVSLAGLLGGDAPEISGQCGLTVGDYAQEIVAGGFPGWAGISGQVRELLTDSYLHQLVEHDFRLAGHRLRNPAAVRRWLRAYAAATATTAAFETIRDAATPGESDKPAKTTTLAFRDTLEAMWVLEPLPAWLPLGSHLSRLKRGPKHHLADTALAARLLDADVDALLGGTAPVAHRTRGVPAAANLLGALFESMVTHDLRVYAQRSGASVSHMRTWNDEREVDIIIEHRGRVLAVEVKLSADLTRHDTRHLRWLRDRLGPALLDAVVVNTGEHAYRDSDGIAIVPAALLGP